MFFSSEWLASQFGNPNYIGSLKRVRYEACYFRIAGPILFHSRIAPGSSMRATLSGNLSVNGLSHHSIDLGDGWVYIDVVRCVPMMDCPPITRYCFERKGNSFMTWNLLIIRRVSLTTRLPDCAKLSPRMMLPIYRICSFKLSNVIWFHIKGWNNKQRPRRSLQITLRPRCLFVIPGIRSKRWLIPCSSRGLRPSHVGASGGR